ncbi:hypothetical protein [Bacillus thuringiensis]|nr:hypothetical protein [Bacillus thuringiensis]
MSPPGLPGTSLLLPGLFGCSEPPSGVFPPSLVLPPLPGFGSGVGVGLTV